MRFTHRNLRALGTLLLASAALAALPSVGSALPIVDVPPLDRPIDPAVGCDWQEFDNDKFLSDTHNIYKIVGYRYREGDKLVFEGEFPRARYFSLLAADDDQFILQPTLTDHAMVASTGHNPNAVGADRLTDPSGTFHAEYRMQARPPGYDTVVNNVSYLGPKATGEPNTGGSLLYRIYLPDQRFNQPANKGVGEWGGATPLRYWFETPSGYTYCSDTEGAEDALIKPPDPTRMDLAGLLGDHDPGDTDTPNPVKWKRVDSVLEVANGGNTDNEYLSADVNNRAGEAFVLYWKAPNTPKQTFFSQPFGAFASYDLRYWSICLIGAGELTGSCAADVDVPPDSFGNHRLMGGFGGAPRPASVPAGEKWFTFPTKDKARGLLLYRIQLPHANWASNPNLLDPGEAVGDQMHPWTPRGVSCPYASLANGCREEYKAIWGTYPEVAPPAQP